MITNDKIVAEYSLLTPFPVEAPSPKAFKPAPTIDDYTKGFFTRCAIIRRNDTISGYEIDPRLIGSVSADLYQIFTFSWVIIGKKNRHVVNGIVEDFGVQEINTTTMIKLSPLLSRIFTNPLEFWQGY